MKTTFRFIIAAIAAIAVFSSCQKELVGETVSNTTDGVRVISVQFDNSTKASLSGFTPAFTNGDKIRVSNSEKSEERPVTVTGTAATFTTTLSGELTAIYPADAAVLTTEATDAPIAASNNFKVFATQTGKVEDAIIAKATIASNSATFTGVTALFEIAPPSGVNTFTIRSLNTIDAATGRRSATPNAAAINTTGADDAAKREITVSVVAGKAYVSLVPGVNLTDLSFEYTVTGATYDGAMKGIPAGEITGALGDATAANAKYTIDSQNWHPYVTIGGKKWATENIGATASNPYGIYFAWAGTTGHALKESPVGKTGLISSAFESDYQFSWTNCPFQTVGTSMFSSKFTKYLGSTSSSCKDASATDADANKTVLDLADDAAYANWGGPWHMPTGGASGDFQTLQTAAPGSWVTEGSTTGYKFTEASGSKTLFFPAAGFGDGADLEYTYPSGAYWSSSLETSNPCSAFYLKFDSGDVNPNEVDVRCFGRSVRPVSD